jgi:hypothetical protein
MRLIASCNEAIACAMSGRYHFVAHAPHGLVVDGKVCAARRTTRSAWCSIVDAHVFADST